MAAASNPTTVSSPAYTTIPGLVAVYFPGKRHPEYPDIDRPGSELFLRSALLFETITHAKKIAEAIREYNEAGGEYQNWVAEYKNETDRLTQVLFPKPRDRGYDFDTNSPIGISVDDREGGEGVLECELGAVQWKTVLEHHIDLVNHIATRIIQSADTQPSHNVRVCATLREFAQMIVNTPLQK